ncbi:MAG TPA: phenylalanine--tRNA ligase subunit beta [Ruminococcaceae bacterium]|nr:phenylalanine--tRNA ligase subunit beta [Oscillospiraceae bacterium]
MKWLNDYVKADMPIKDFVAGMTMSGSKVETYRSLSEPLKNIVVGKVLSIEKHQDSEKLWICQLDAGRDKPVQIVTAAQNLYVGAVVPVVLDGGVCIDRHNNTVAKIKKGKLRGVESEGMMCSFDELGMDNSDFPYASPDGILILNDDPDFDKFTVGEDICKAVGIDDICVEFEITNNRPDCLSVIGLAREAHAAFQLPLNLKPPKFKGIDCDINRELSVAVENTQLCSRYMAAKVKNIKIEPSPRWMAERLRACGVRAINNLVDITNFVMLEYGHPMHAFDARYVEGNKIVVRNAKEGEILKLLDENTPELKLTPDMLVICNEKEPMALAGIMGGRNSGIREDTEEVIFEAACFDGVNVRRTAKKAGVRTESSSRFEKRLDPENAKNALYRALELIEELGCGEVVNTVIDVYPSPAEPFSLKLDADWVNRFLGAEIPEKEQFDILRRLDFAVNEETKEVSPPAVRIDIERPCDLAEEVARIYGYNNIKTTVPRLSSHSAQTPMELFQRKLLGIMLSQGCCETMTFSFISPRGYEKCRIEENDRESVKIINPLGEDTGVMRTTLIPSMMELTARNINARNLSGRFFEIGRVYLPVGDVNVLPVEKDQLICTVYGEGEDFFSVKGIAEEITEKCGIKARFTALRSNKTFHTGRCAEITDEEGKVLGVCGEIHPIVAENYGIEKFRIYMLILKLDEMLESAAEDTKYTALPKFPASVRDISVICDSEVSNGDITELVSQKAKHLESLRLFDIYTGEQVPDGKKSLSYKLTFRKSDATMTDEELDKIMSKVIDALAEKNITLRS